MVTTVSAQPAELPNISGYTVLTSIYQGARTEVYRAIQDSSQQPVVIKVLSQTYPSFSELTHFRNQYVITQNLPIPGIARPLALEPWHNGYALVTEDFDGISLQQYLATQPAAEQTLPVETCLGIALQMTDILHELGQHRVVHKDIKPANILIHPESKRIQLIDFSIASLLPKETQGIQNPNVLEGTLPYLAPEQTGRMNRGVDYRADFYGLGVTLYQLLTGKLPFSAADPLELVHCHLAKSPAPPFQINTEIPLVLSRLVLKLMAKNAEDRYQSALGIKYDLEKVIQEIKEFGAANDFELGQRDQCDRFLIPEKLYGRDPEVRQLLEAFERTSQGNAEVMLVAGLSGIGKTAVINEVHKPITRQHGYFVKGKFDQFNRNIPFSAFVQAFRSLMGQLLSESDQQLAAWKSKILQAVGDSGQVIIDIIPELAHILGKQPAVSELSGSAAQNRFNLLLSKFVQVFASKEHPLVVFLDDLQWADAASLKLLKILMDSPEAGHFLILGAYRDNEVFPAHPFMLTLDELKNTGTLLTTLTLAPLNEGDLQHLVADTLLCEPQTAAPLAQLIYPKTQGNPFFTSQFLTGLYEDECISFNPQLGHWECDLTQVRALALTDNVVEFLVQRLTKLPEATQNVLRLAACIGNQFDLSTLAIVCSLSPDSVTTNLWKSLQEGFIIPENETYKFYQGDLDQGGLGKEHKTQTELIRYHFVHDRIQQAAYALIPEEQKQATHWKIGQLLQQNLSAQGQSQQLFEIVNQLNLGKAHALSHEAKQHLAELNLQAGQKAKHSAAHQAAQNYYEIGIELLSSAAWQDHYNLNYELHRHASEAAYLAGNFDRAEALYGITVAEAQTPLDKAAIYRIQVTQYQLQGRNSEAIVIQRESLELLGWSMPETTESIDANLNEQIEIVSDFLSQQSIESILDLPKMTDERIAEMLRILQILFYTAWLDGQPSLALLALAKMTALSMQHGNSEMSPFGYAGYGLIANIMLKDAAMADRFGAMAVELCEQFDNADVRGMTNFIFAADVHSWSRPLEEVDTYYDNAFKYSMEAGNWLTVSFVIMLSGSDRLTYGKNLRDLYVIAQTHEAFLKQIKSLENLDAFTAGVLQPVRHLLGLTQTPDSFDDEEFSETAYLEKYENTPYHLVWFYSVKIRHAYLLGQQDQYLSLIPKLSIIENTVATHAKVPSSVFYVALMHLSLIETAPDKTQRHTHWQALLGLEERLNTWAQDCPENIRHKCLLIQAEKARLNKQVADAIDLYDQAIVQAQAQSYEYEEALANELAAKFYLAWGKEKVAAGYLQAAYYSYAHWGAKAKTDALEKHHSALLTRILQPVNRPFEPLNPLETLGTVYSPLISAHSISASSSPISAHRTTQTKTTTTINAALDFAAIIKASHALSSTIELNELLSQLTTVILQQSGADYCALTLPDSEGIWNLRALATPSHTQHLCEPMAEHPHLPVNLLQYIKNTRETIASEQLNTGLPIYDNYLEQVKPRSLLCLPLLNQGQLRGLLYLHNQTLSGVFTQERRLVLDFLSTQAAISLENARLYQQAQVYAQQIKDSQLKTVQTEKMASLGNLVAGVAHEINNPIGFLNGSVDNAENYVEELIDHLSLYQQHYPQAVDEIQKDAEEIQLDFICEDLPKLLKSMKEANQRITAISRSLRTFSRADTEHKVSADLHEGLDSTLLILKYRLKANENRPAIEVIKDYGQLPELDCFPGQLNQVFMNLLANAIDVFDEAAQQSDFSDLEGKSQVITVTTATSTDRAAIEIRIRDNGKGMPENIKARIFDHLFTTKGVGKGTGLGLAIARQIITEVHGGQLSVTSALGKGTEFYIRLPITPSTNAQTNSR